ILRTGYISMSTGPYFDAFVDEVAAYVVFWWQSVRHEELHRHEALTTARDALAALTYTDAARGEISLWDRLPFKLLVSDGRRILVDYASLPEVLSELFRQVAFVEGAAANAKGRAFHDEVVRRAIDSGLTQWETDRRLIAPNAEQRDIDASFLVGAVLYV